MENILDTRAVWKNSE